MKGSKEIIVLLALLAVAIAGVLAYVINRRAAMRAQPTEQRAKVVGPLAPASHPMVDLGGKNNRKTIDFSGAKPVVSDTPEDRAALEQGLKDIEEARKNVIFEREKKTEPKQP